MTGPQVARVEMLVELGRLAEAEPLVQALLAQDPEDAGLHGLQAQIGLGLERPESALAAAERVIALEPDDEWGHRLRSVALGALGRPEEALAAAVEAVRRSPGQWQTHLRHAGAAAEVRGRLLEAQAAAERAIALAPGEPDTHFMWGVIAQARSEDDAARAAYHRTLALDPEHPEALNNLTVLDGMTNLPKAARGFASALRHDPHNAMARENLEVLIARALAVVALLHYCLLVVALLVFQAQPGDMRDARPTPGTWILGLGAPLLSGLYLGSLAHRTPRAVREFARHHLRKRDQLIGVLCLAAIAGLIVVATCIPGMVWVGERTLLYGGIMMIVVLVLAIAKRGVRE